MLIYILLKVYKIAWQIISPVLYYYLKWRVRIGKEDPVRFLEKLMLHSPQARHDGKLIWLHASSVGELNSLLPLTDTLIQNKEKEKIKYTFLLTTSTINSSNILEKSKIYKENRNNIIHQFFPLDVSSIVTKFLQHWKPQLVIFVESEIWPNIIIAATEIAPVILVNAKMSQNAIKQWSKLPALAKYIFSRFASILPSSQIDLEHFKKLSLENIFYIGNLKYDAPPLQYDNAEMQILKQQTSERICWVAASTHAGEEEVILESHINVKSIVPNLLTVIIPRHPNRSIDIIHIIEKLNLTYTLFSRRSKEEIKSDIYLVDAIGYTGLFYDFSSIVLMGGSLVPIGGHNLLEPARFNCAIITGPYTEKCMSMAEDLVHNNALLTVKNAKELTKCLLKLYNDDSYLKDLQRAAFTFTDKYKNILEKTREFILKFL